MQKIHVMGVINNVQWLDKQRTLLTPKVDQFYKGMVARSAAQATGTAANRVTVLQGLVSHCRRGKVNSAEFNARFCGS